MNRTSKTRSASSGTPNLKPKLISWIASRSGARRGRRGGRRCARAARAATGRDVSRTTSASVADRLEQPPLLGDRAGDPALVGERMAVARLREAPDEDLVARLEEEHLGPDAAALERAAHGAERERRVAGPDVEDDGDPREALAGRSRRARRGRAAARPAGCRRRCSRGPRTASPPRSCRRPTAAEDDDVLADPAAVRRAPAGSLAVEAHGRR